MIAHIIIIFQRAGVLHAGILGLGLYTFLDFQGWFLCVTYLILGSLVTKIKMKEKKVRIYIILCYYCYFH